MSFQIEIICLLDKACIGREHSLNCRVLNRERGEVLLRREKARRKTQIEADILGDPQPHDSTQVTGSEAFCIEHGMTHELPGDPSCDFEDGLGNPVPEVIPGTMAALDSLSIRVEGGTQ